MGQTQVEKEGEKEKEKRDQDAVVNLVLVHRDRADMHRRVLPSVYGLSLHSQPKDKKRDDKRTSLWTPSSLVSLIVWWKLTRRNAKR